MELLNHNSIAVLTFPPAPRFPRLGVEQLNDLERDLKMLERESLFEAVVIASNAHSFATGAALEEVAALDGTAGREFALRGQALLKRIERFPAPVVAAIRGYCLGGGLDLALACRARIASYDSSFAHPGATLGLLTGWGGTQRLPRLVGKHSALQMLLAGERVPATQALTLGLVDELSPSQDLIERAVQFAESLARKRHLSPIRSGPARFN